MYICGMCCHLENQLDDLNAKYQRLAELYGQQQRIIEKLSKNGFKECDEHTIITYQLKPHQEV